MYLRKIRSLIVVLAMVLVLFSCKHHGGKKIGLLLHDLEGRWFTDIEFLEKHAKEAGYELVIKNAEGNENLQLAQANELVEEGVGVILVVAVNQNTAAGIVRTAHDNHIKVIAYDRIIINSDLDYLISYEYKEIGRMIAEYAYSKVPNGNYVMLWGDASDNNARLMREGQEEFLQSYVTSGDIHLVYRTFTDGWSDVVAIQKMQKVVDYSAEPIDVVMASNDNIGLAALKVFNDNNLKIPTVITGQDATLDACKSILKGGQTMSIYKSTNKMAFEAIKLATDIVEDRKVNQVKGLVNNNRKDVPTLFLSPVVVDKTNILRTVVDDGLYSEEELLIP